MTALPKVTGDEKPTTRGPAELHQAPGTRMLRVYACGLRLRLSEIRYTARDSMSNIQCSTRLIASTQLMAHDDLCVYIRDIHNAQKVAVYKPVLWARDPVPTPSTTFIKVILRGDTNVIGGEIPVLCVLI